MTTQTPDKQNRRRDVIRTIVVVIVLAAAVIGIAIGGGRKKPVSSMATPDIAVLHVIETVKPGEPMTLSLSPLKVSIEAAENVLSQEGFLSITVRDPAPYQDKDLANGWYRPRVVDVAFYSVNGKLVQDFIPGNLINVCFSVSPESWSVYFRDESSYQVQYYDESIAAPLWLALPTYGRVDTQQICGQARHLSLFALATKSASEPILPATEMPYEAP